MKKFVLATLLPLMGASSFAQLYAGAGVGIGHQNLDCGYKVYGGYKLNQMLSAEAGYMDIGRAKLADDANNLEFAVKVLVLNAAARFELVPELNGVARLGVASVDAKVAGTASAASTRTKPYIGLGLEYRIKKDLKAVAYLDMTKATIQAAGGDSSSNVRLIGLGLEQDF
jgi:OOP family OmpA-OmpF porin